MKRRRRHLPMDRMITALLGGNQSGDDGGRIVGFEPTVGGDGALARAVGADVHHNDAVAGEEKDAGVFENAHAVIRNAMENQYPIAVGVRGTDFPSSKQDAVRCANVEIFAMSMDLAECGIVFEDEIGSELPAEGMEKRGPEKPSAHGRQCWREEEHDQQDANGPAAHGLCLEIPESSQPRSGATWRLKWMGTLPPVSPNVCL